MAKGLNRKEKHHLKKTREAAMNAGAEGLMFDRRGRPADYLRGMYDNEAVWLICGGPSVRGMDLSPLNQRGIVTASVNNVATVHRPHLWFTVDNQTQFSDAIWRDPAVMKFCKRKYIGKFLHSWNGDGYSEVMIRPRNLSNVWGFDHTDMGKTPWNPAEFLKQRLPVWGSTKAENDPDGKKYHKSVMLIAIRLLYWLGFRRVYIIGADFRMKEKQPYGFDEVAEPGRCNSNNSLYRWLNRRFDELQPHFRQAGYEVFNCTPGGDLKSFPRLGFLQSIEIELNDFPEIRTRGMYRI